MEIQYLKKTTALILITLLTLTISQQTLAHEDHHVDDFEENWSPENVDEDLELMPDFFEFFNRGCTKANSQQIATVNSGNNKRSEFINACLNSTGSEKWCAQIERPNPSSKNTFNCTYSPSQPHRLIHPTTSTWKHAFKAIDLIIKLQSRGICVSQIYNWWRPEPYNKNVGGAAGRHPFGTSVDVRFCTNSDAIKGFDELCKYRRAGEVRALGYYGSTGVHIGVGDNTANTWGRSCP